jgi:hypothetical protein
MTGIGILKPDRRGMFRFGDVFRVKLVDALLNGGFTSRHVEWAVSEGHLNLDLATSTCPSSRVSGPSERSPNSCRREGRGRPSCPPCTPRSVCPARPVIADLHR